VIHQLQQIVDGSRIVREGRVVETDAFVFGGDESGKLRELDEELLTVVDDVF
jgi:hypothetical protein